MFEVRQSQYRYCRYTPRDLYKGRVNVRVNISNLLYTIRFVPIVFQRECGFMQIMNYVRLFGITSRNLNAQKKTLRLLSNPQNSKGSREIALTKLIKWGNFISLSKNTTSSQGYKTLNNSVERKTSKKNNFENN